jgi:hypothetical protein
LRVWADTPDGIAAKSLAMRTALQGIDGAEFMQVNNAARRATSSTRRSPGTSGAPTAGWDIYVENHNLADLMPLSSTFTGTSRRPRPSTTARGAASSACGWSPPTGPRSTRSSSASTAPGKSALLMDLMSQSDCDWAYRFYQEEGMAFVTQAQLCGMRAWSCAESGESTLNPFDTLGLPLTSAARRGS